MKILVTGTAGFIGFHVAKRLLEMGHHVVGLDVINDYYDVSLKHARLGELGISFSDIIPGEMLRSTHYEHHSFIQLALEDKDNVFKVFQEERFDAVCHLAAQAGVRYSLENPEAYIQSNIVGFMTILEGCRQFGVSNLSYASSSSVYGTNTSMPFRVSDKTDTPVSLYAATKKSNELMAHSYAHLYQMKVTGLRFFTVYGPWGRPDMAPMLFTDAIVNDRPIKVFNHGNMSRDFTFIDDIVNGVVCIIEKPSDHVSVYNIGHNSPVKLMDFITCLETSLGKKSEKIFMEMQDGDVERTYADVSDLINNFSYKPDTSLDEGVDAFVSWYNSFYCE